MVEQGGSKRGAALRRRLVQFVAVVILAIVILTLMGVPALLIIEVFGLAIILGVSALVLILVMSGNLARRPR